MSKHATKKVPSVVKEDRAVTLIRASRSGNQLLRTKVIASLLRVDVNAAEALCALGAIRGAFKRRSTWYAKGRDLSKFISNCSEGRVDPYTCFALHEARIDVLMRRLWPEEEGA